MDSKLIFECVSGSHLYGTAGPNSDIDTRGVELEALQYILGLTRTEHTVITKPEDRTIYTLKFFTNLLLDCNPNIIELIFVEPPNCNYVSPEWRKFRSVARENSLSQDKIRRTFAGYALSQLKKINTHHKWMTGEPPKLPLPEDYGREHKTILGNEVDIWADFQLKQKYDADKKHYDQYQQWLKQRNPARHELEEKYGFDSKNGMHLVRLILEAETLLASGQLSFPLPYAKFLLDVKNGYFDYDGIIAYADKTLKNLETLKSDLPHKVNFNKMEEIVMEIYSEYVTSKLR